MNLTKDPIPKLVWHLALPATIGFFFNTMYNVVDTYLAGLLSTEAQAALSLSFPAFFVLIALTTGISSGVTAITGTFIGEGKKEEARRTSSQAIVFSVILGLIIMAIGFLVVPSLFRILGASGEYLEISVRYMYFILPSVIFIAIGSTGNAILSALGDTKTYSKTLIFGFFANIILSPTLMYGWSIFPEMGVAGIALATSIIQLLTASYLTYRVQHCELPYSKNREDYKPHLTYFKEIATQGFPASFSMLTVAIGIFVITYFISQFSTEAVAAYGIATRIEQIALLPMIGFNIATLTLIAQNAGAKQYDRIKEVIRYCFSRATTMMTLGVIFVFAFRTKLMELFSSDPAVVDIGVEYLGIAAFAFYSYVILFLCDAIFRGYKRPMIPLTIGIIRQIALPALIFPIIVTMLQLPIIYLWGSIIGIVIVSSVGYLFYMYKVVYK